MRAVSDARAVVVLDKVHEDVGHLGPLYAATASEEGLWVGGASAYGRATLLFSPDAVRFERRTPPDLYQHRTLLSLPDGRLLAGGQYGLAKSIDGGFGWTKVAGWRDACWRLTPAADGTLWATSNGGIASSTDGEVWTRFESPDARAGFEGTVACDAGVFTVLGEQVHALRDGHLGAVHRFPGHELHGIARSPDGLILAVGSGGLVARSRDGAGWQTVTAGADDLHDVAWCEDRFLMAGAGGALLSTTDGEQVTPVETDSRADAWLVLPFRGGVVVCGETTTTIGPRTKWGSLAWLGPSPVAAPAQPGEPLPARRSRGAHTPTGRARLGLPDFDELSVAEAVRRYPVLRPFCEYNEPDVVRLYLGDLVLDRYETPDDLGQRSLVIVDGDLWIERHVELNAHADDDDRLGLFVTGSLSAHSVWLYGDPELHIGGDLDVTDLVVCGGGSEGALDVAGALRARALAAAPWANVAVGGEVDAIVVGETGGLDKTKGRRLAPRQVLLPGYVDDNDDPDVPALRAAIESGVDALRDTTAW